MEKEEKIEVSKKSDWNQWLAVVLLVLLVMNGMTWFTVASINEKEDCPDCNLECPPIEACPECPGFNEKRYPEDDIELNHTPTGWEIFWYNKSIGTYNLREFSNSTDMTDWLYDLGHWSDTSFPSEDYPLSRYQKETVLIWIMLIGYHEQTGIWLID